MRRLHSRAEGSVLIWTILVITILSLGAAELLRIVSSKYHSALHTATWQEALLAAESGVDLAIRELRKSLHPGANGAWEGWTSVPGDGVVSHGLTTIPNAGLAGTPMTIDVNVDAPASLRDQTNSWQYYRIRTVGTMPITGPARGSGSREDARLRKLSLRWDRFTNGVLNSQAVDSPRVSRRVEAIVRPVSSFDQAVISLGALNLNDANIVIDSYDSRDPNKSRPNPDDPNGPGLYDPAERQENGNIATNGNLINAGNAYIFGSVATNAGTISGAANVTGTQRTDFYQDLIPVGAPVWPSINSSVATVYGNTNLTANSVEGAADSRYRLSSVVLAGHETLRLTGNADGSPTYIELYVTGDISSTGNSQIVVDPGVKAKIYFAGDVKVSGNGLVNKNNQPGDLQMFGITPADNSSRTVELGGNGLLTAAVYAPAYDVHINNAGTAGTAVGSFVGKTFKMTGVTDLHYDEALSAGGKVTSYKIVSWFEDVR